MFLMDLIMMFCFLLDADDERCDHHFWLGARIQIEPRAMVSRQGYWLLLLFFPLVARQGSSWSTRETKQGAIKFISRRDACLTIIVATAAVAPIKSRAQDNSSSNNKNNCSEECLAERRRIIQERRAMMQQSRTTTKRQDMFDLSRQRAALYNTTYQGASCDTLPGVPCL
jgi:hypothetical protein